MDPLSELKNYVDLRFEQLRLLLSGILSRTSSLLCFIFIASILAMLILVMLCIVLSQVLSGVVGEPWGALIVCGAIILLLLLLVGLRKKIFRSTFDSLFSSALGNPTSDIDKKSEDVERRIDSSKEILKSRCDTLYLGATSLKTLLTVLDLLKKDKGKESESVEGAEKTGQDI